MSRNSHGEAEVCLISAFDTQHESRNKTQDHRREQVHDDVWKEVIQWVTKGKLLEVRGKVQVRHIIQSHVIHDA